MLNGKVAIVTGSGRGLGLAYAQELARLGAAVVVNDIDEATAAAAAAGIRESGGRASHCTAAVGSTESAEELVATAVRDFGRLDILVANAGILRDTVVWKMTDEDFDSVINVHLRGTFTCVRASAIQMRAQGEGGSIIAIGSTTGQRGNFGQGNYAAAKAGILGMVRTWAMELQRSNITVNAVVPVAATPMTGTVPFFQQYVEDAAAGRELPAFARRVLGFGTPNDVVGLVGFLASDAASAVTGQAVGIGGDRLSLWSHPNEITNAFSDGGWSAEEIAEGWETLLGKHVQSLGPDIPAQHPATK